MVTEVRPRARRSRASVISASVFASTALVGSSSTRMGAFLRKARAMDMRWRSPPESVTPRSPTCVRYPSGRRRMKSWASAAFAASTISLSVAPGRP